MLSYHLRRIPPSSDQRSAITQMDQFGTEYLSIDCANRTLGIAHAFAYSKMDIVKRSLRAMKTILKSNCDKLQGLSLDQYLKAQFNPLLFLRLEKVDLLKGLVKSFTDLERIDIIIEYLDSLNVRNPKVIVEKQPKFNTTSPLVQTAVVTWARMHKFEVIEVENGAKTTPTWCGTVKQIRLALEIEAGKKSKAISYRARKIHSTRNFLHLAEKYNWYVPQGKLDDVADAVMQLVVTLGIE